MKKPFLEKVTIAEEHLGHKLPQDYLDFIKDYGSQCVGFGYWFDLEELELATEYDIVNFLVVEEHPELLSEEDCKHLLPILSDNDSYIVMDLREDGKGVFIIWSDEVGLGFQSSTFTEFVHKLKATITDKHEDYNYFD